MTDLEFRQEWVRTGKPPTQPFHEDRKEHQRHFDLEGNKLMGPKNTTEERTDYGQDQYHRFWTNDIPKPMSYDNTILELEKNRELMPEGMIV